MSESSVDLSDRKELIWLSELVRDVRAAVPAFRPLLVGAMARDLLLHYARAVPIARLYEEAAHLLEADDFDYEAAGGWLAGHDAAHQIVVCCPTPDRLLDKCEEVLSKETDPSTSGNPQ